MDDANSNYWPFRGRNKPPNVITHSQLTHHSPLYQAQTFLIVKLMFLLWSFVNLDDSVTCANSWTSRYKYLSLLFSTLSLLSSLRQCGRPAPWHAFRTREVKIEVHKISRLLSNLTDAWERHGQLEWEWLFSKEKIICVPPNMVSLFSDITSLGDWKLSDTH